MADFLHCFPDLKTVYLVFNHVEQGPIEPDDDKTHTVTGDPEPLDAALTQRGDQQGR